MQTTAFKRSLKGKLGRWVGGHFGLQTLLCAGPRCRRFTIAHRWLRRDGIFLRDRWLCSPLCFEEAVAAMLETAGPGRRFTMPRLPRMPFRLILLQREQISEPELQFALEYSENSGLPIGPVIVRLGFATVEQVASARAAENGCAFYALPPAALAPELRLPLSLSHACEAAAVHATADRIMLGFADRVDRGLAQMMEQVTGQRVECCLVTRAHLLRQLALDAAQAGLSSQITSPAHPVSRLAAAQHLGEQALCTGAEAVGVGRAGQRLWVRFTGNSDQVVDSVFELSEEAVKPGIPLSGRMRPRLEKKTRVL